MLEVISQLATQTGKRYVGPGGVEMIVTKGGDGTITDGDIPLGLKGSEEGFGGATTKPDSPELSLGKRYQSPGGEVMVLITKAGPCDLRYDGVSMEVQQPRPLPSSD